MYYEGRTHEMDNQERKESHDDIGNKSRTETHTENRDKGTRTEGNDIIITGNPGVEARDSRGT